MSSEPDAIAIGLLGRDRTVLRRAARVIRAAAQLEWVAAEDDPLVLRSQLAESTRLLACEDADAELVLGWIGASFPKARLMAWSHDPASSLIALAGRDDRLVSLLGWPTFQSMPRSWELALATRAILSASCEATALGDLFTGVPAAVEFHPRSQKDRDATIAEITRLVERAGAADRVSARIASVAHELIINATYDAPIDANGDPCYAHDRRTPIVVRDAEIPIVQFATDGILVAIQVVDRFGRLSRDHVLASIQRGHEAGRAAADVLDRSNGGAGLGMWRVYSSSAVTIVDVLPGHTTAVTAVFDVDLGPREARTLPPSLHLFDRGRLG